MNVAKIINAEPVTKGVALQQIVREYNRVLNDTPDSPYVYVDTSQEVYQELADDGHLVLFTNEIHEYEGYFPCQPTAAGISKTAPAHSCAPVDKAVGIDDAVPVPEVVRKKPKSKYDIIDELEVGQSAYFALAPNDTMELLKGRMQNKASKKNHQYSEPHPTKTRTHRGATVPVKVAIRKFLCRVASPDDPRGPDGVRIHRVPVEE